MTILALDTMGTLALSLVAAAVYAALLWVALAYFVVRDARRRSASMSFMALAALLGFVPPFLGALVYLVVRPPRTLEEQRTLELEERAFADSPNSNGQVRPCPSCGKDIDSDFVLCPYCRTQFSRRCRGCQRSLRLGWSVCPYCAEEVGTHVLPSRVGRAAPS